MSGRHILELQHVRYEESEGSHGRSSTHHYEQLVCKTCGEKVGDESWVWNNHTTDGRAYISKLETEHNLDKLFALLEEMHQA